MKRIMIGGCLLYALLWLLFLIGQYVASLNNLSYQPIVVAVFRVVAFLFPVLLIGYGIGKGIDKRNVRIFCFSLYSVAVLLLSIVFLFVGLLSLPEQRTMDCGYLQLAKGEFLSETQYSYGERKYLLFMRGFQWDTQHNIHILDSTYHTQFSLAKDRGDGIERYSPKEHPEIAVRIYDHELDGTLDDYQYKLTSNIALDYYHKNALTWDYRFDHDYEGNMCIFVHSGDNLELYARDLAAMIKKANQDPFYRENVGWIRLEMDHGTSQVLYFGDYEPFKEEGRSSGYYGKAENVLHELKGWTKRNE